MKPLRLTIQAFGPYAGEQLFDFRKLEERNLFLITGDTGSGKTTMFDAMAIALFGESSGGDRKSSEMRSDFAEKTTPTFCRFEFQLRDKIYRSSYHPEQQRPKARGEGFTTQGAKAYLHQLEAVEQPDQDANCLAEGVSKSKEAVSNILQLNSRQFRQVIMLAQGQFRELLEANSNEREAIFERLFGTQLYSDIQNDLKEKSRGIGSEIDRQRQALALRLETITCVDTTAVTEEIKRLDLQIKKSEDEVEQALARVKLADASLHLLREQNVKLDAFAQATVELKQVNEGKSLHEKNVLALELHREAQGIFPTVESRVSLRVKSRALTTSKTSIAEKGEDLAENLLQAGNLFTESKEQQPEIDRLLQTIHKLKSMKPAIAEWESYAQTVMATKQKKDDLEQKEQALKTSSLAFDLRLKEME